MDLHQELYVPEYLSDCGAELGPEAAAFARDSVIGSLLCITKTTAAPHPVNE